MFKNSASAFTFAELLIALSILGVIATFTIPKILTAQQSAANMAITKEAMGTISGAFTTYQSKNSLSPNFHISDMTAYINYVALDSTSLIDKGYNKTGTITCTSTAPCLKLHNGSVLTYYGGAVGTANGNYFGVLDGSHYIYFFSRSRWRSD